MRRWQRWCVVVLGTALLVAVPLGMRALPVTDSGLSAAALLDRVRASHDRGWSGYVETRGTIVLPDVDHFTDVASLLGGETRLRVWWQSADRWRVDRLLASGEDDLIHQGPQTIAYSYEQQRAVITVDPTIRLPRTADLLPPELGHRVIDGVTAGDVSRIASRRVAGVAAAGLRILPASDASSVDHVDLWADPTTGVPLRVEVYGGGSGGPAFTTTFAEFSGQRPGDTDVDYTPEGRTDVRHEDVLDIADAANRFAPVQPPHRVAGLRETSASDGAVGIYGAGLTSLIVVPLRDRDADPLRQQLGLTVGSVVDPTGTRATIGPLGALVTGAAGQSGWLLAGTVDAATLEAAARDVLQHSVYVGARQ